MDEDEFKQEELDLEIERKRLQIEDNNAQRDAQRNMAWFALFGMLLYPATVIFTTFLGLDKAADILGNMSHVYFVSVAAIVAAFYGKEAMDKKHAHARGAK